MQISSINFYLPSFSSKRKFKKMFKKCAYSGENFETHNPRTIEHIITRSNGGSDDYSNLIVVKKSWNEKRSSVSLDEFIKKYPQVEENIKTSVQNMQGKTINGIDWAKEVKNTLKLAIGRDIFENQN